MRPNCPLNSIGWASTLRIHLAGPKVTSLDTFQRLDNGLYLGRPHESFHFLPVLQDHERRPELDAKRAPEGLATPVGDLDVTHTRMRGQRFGDQRLRAAAMAAPGSAELDHGGTGKLVYFSALRLDFRVGSRHPHGWPTLISRMFFATLLELLVVFEFTLYFVARRNDRSVAITLGASFS